MPLFDTLTDDERDLADQVRAGTLAQLRNRRTDPRPVIRAELIRELMFGAPATADPNGRDLGVRLTGAQIAGRLDLSDFNLRRHAPPALVLDDCVVDGDIELDGAHLSRLCLRFSCIRKISLRNAQIDGNFDFSNTKPLRIEAGAFEPAWIDARNASIHGQLIGSGATLLLPPLMRTPAMIAVEGPMYALWLVNAEIHGSVRLRNGFTATGGISLDAAHVHGHVLCDGAQLAAGEDDAFNAQSARIDGNLLLSNDCVVEGSVWLLGARIGGYAHLRDTKITFRPPAPDPASDPPAALIVDQADIGASLQLDRTQIDGGHISFVGTRVRGHLECSDLKVSNIADRPQAFRGMNAEVGQNALFYSVVFEGPVDLLGARINGSLAFDGSKIERPQNDRTKAALKASHLSVGGDLTFEVVDATQPPMPRPRSTFFSRGMIDLTGAAIAGSLTFRDGRIENWSEDGTGTALLAEQIRVGAALTFRDGFCAHGEVNLAGATIGRDLKCENVRFRNAKSDRIYDLERNNLASSGPVFGSAIYAKDIRIGDDLQFFHTRAKGNLRFERAEITGSLTWDGLTISARPHDKAAAPLDLQRARVGSALKAIKLHFVGPQSEIDLIGARASSILSSWPDGWGGLKQDYNTGGQCFLKLDGLVYDRIELAPHPPPPPNKILRYLWDVWRPFTFPPSHPRGDLLLDWLLHQHRPVRGQEDFSPQPFRQLTRVLRAQGDEEASRTITTAENLATPMDEWLANLLHRPFGTLFGFGLSRKRATCFLLAYISLGMVGVHWAQEDHFLVEESVVVAPAYMTDSSSTRHRVFLKAKADEEKETEILCTDTASNWPTDFVYALDMIVPFIPLHQESKCEIDPRDELWPTTWRVARAVYSIAGWIIFSLWLVTFSGLFRRSEEAE